MKRSQFIAVSAFVGLALTASAMAQMGGGGMRGQPVKRADVKAQVKARFAMVDANKDGKATKEEFMAARDAWRSEMRGKMFDLVDADKNGQISRQEMEATQAKREAKREERMGEMRKRRAEMGGAGGAGMGPGMRHGGMGGMRRGMGPGGMGKMGNGQGFDKLDADGNGSVTEAEMVKMAMARFDASDTNKDGTVTQEERRAAISGQMREGKGH